MKKIAFISSIVFSVNALACPVATPVDRCSNIKIEQFNTIVVYQCKMQNGDTCNIAYAGGSLEMQCYK
jgi:hypothetical protein